MYVVLILSLGDAKCFFALAFSVLHYSVLSNAELGETVRIMTDLQILFFLKLVFQDVFFFFSKLPKSLCLATSSIVQFCSVEPDVGDVRRARCVY